MVGFPPAFFQLRKFWKLNGTIAQAYPGLMQSRRGTGVVGSLYLCNVMVAVMKGKESGCSARVSAYADDDG